MGKKVLPALPPASWIQRVDVALVATTGVSTDFLLERDRVLAEWFARDLAPDEVPAKIEPVDLAIARWLATFNGATWRTYERALRRLAIEAALPSVDDARSLLRRSIDAPDAIEALLERYIGTTDKKAGTVRVRLCALHRATVALHNAGLARRPIDVGRPEHADVDLAAPSTELLDALYRSTADCKDARTARARAEMLLAADGLRAREICALNVEHVEHRQVVVENKRVVISQRTAEAVRSWLGRRGTAPGPLFVRFDGRTGRLTCERLTTRSLERDMVRISRGAVTLRSLRRLAVVDAVEREGWTAGDRVARLTRRDGVIRLVEGAIANGSPRHFPGRP